MAHKQKNFCENSYLMGKKWKGTHITNRIFFEKLLTFILQVCIYNKAHQTYNYAAGSNAAEDDQRRNVFRWTPGGADYDSLWGIIDKGDGNYGIYSEYYGEYLYASESKKNSDRRYNIWFTSITICSKIRIWTNVIYNI